MDFAYWSAAHWPLAPLPLTSTGSEHTKKEKVVLRSSLFIVGSLTPSLKCPICCWTFGTMQ